MLVKLTPAATCRVGSGVVADDYSTSSRFLVVLVRIYRINHATRGAFEGTLQVSRICK